MEQMSPEEIAMNYPIIAIELAIKLKKNMRFDKTKKDDENGTWKKMSNL